VRESEGLHMKKNWTQEREGWQGLWSGLGVTLWFLLLVLPGMMPAQEEKPASSSPTATGTAGKDPLSPKKGGTREVEKAASSSRTASDPSTQSPARASRPSAQSHAPASHASAQSHATAAGGAKPSVGAKKAAPAGHGNTAASKPEHPK
jgi:hypothetical protein